MTFCSLKDVQSQDAKVVETAIRQAFAEDHLSHLVFCMFFFCKWWCQCKQWFKKWTHHSTSRKWLTLGCVSHHLELALEDSLADVMNDIHDVLTFLFYLYKKSSKKLIQLHALLKDVYSFKNNQVRQSKASGTRWIACIMHSMTAFVDKFGVYLKHLVNVV